MKKRLLPEELPELLFMTMTYQSHAIYLFGNTFKYKRFNENNSFYTKENKQFYSGIKDQLEETSTVISFPTSIVEDKYKLYGVVSPYINGTTLDKINRNLPFMALLNQICRLENEIMRLTEKGWYLDDINSRNIITNNQEDLVLTIIDTDFYVKRSDLSYEELLRRNRRQLAWAIIEGLFPGILVSKTINKKVIKNAYLLATNGNISITDFIFILIDNTSKDKTPDTVDSFIKLV